MHATCVSIEGHGVLVRGEPGSGKSDLALRLIDGPGCGTGGEMMAARLVADDQVCLLVTEKGITASPPDALAGLLEIRGIGIVNCDHVPEAVLALIVDLNAAERTERLPELSESSVDLLGAALPRIWVDAARPSAPARVRAGLMATISSS